ncbi:60S ribosomal protein L31 [Tanacetum coccineum]
MCAWVFHGSKDSVALTARKLWDVIIGERPKNLRFSCIIKADEKKLGHTGFRKFPRLASSPQEFGSVSLSTQDTLLMSSITQDITQTCSTDYLWSLIMLHSSHYNDYLGSGVSPSKSTLMLPGLSTTSIGRHTRVLSRVCTHANLGSYRNQSGSLRYPKVESETTKICQRGCDRIYNRGLMLLVHEIQISSPVVEGELESWRSFGLVVKRCNCAAISEVMKMVEKTKGGARKEDVVTREYTINVHKPLHGWLCVGGQDVSSMTADGNLNYVCDLNGKSLINAANMKKYRYVATHQGFDITVGVLLRQCEVKKFEEFDIGEKISIVIIDG